MEEERIPTEEIQETSSDISEEIDSLIELIEAFEDSQESEPIEEPTLVEEEIEESVISEEEQALLQEIIDAEDNAIPLNSATLLIDESTSRFSSAIWYEAIKKKTIILAGLGGIGSYVAFLLARMKPFRMTLYDDDKVEAANMSGQFYSKMDIGQYKANAIYKTMKNYADYYLGNVYVQKYLYNSPAGPIMICGFDNMEARKIFFQRWVDFVLNKPESERGRCLFIDGRLAAEEFQVFAIQGDDNRAIELYESEWLFSDRQAEETLCSYKQTTFMANMIGSVMVNIFVNFVANECEPIFPRDVPFLTTYDASRMYFKVEM